MYQTQLSFVSIENETSFICGHLFAHIHPNIVKVLESEFTDKIGYTGSIPVGRNIFFSKNFYPRPVDITSTVKNVFFKQVYLLKITFRAIRNNV